ncbi:similar to Saccharomyces cerevisiae YKR090W PXL1 LIM domain-containing protein that localizes to sites of polarized growth [Maudiozyma saulgeensis]|uniref:Similar to Saccharomyces cerevisiae YKR090W PXL1 LIM domain-containing protein that localizes to sites of polarized growth n=1 Tax=Maudiozyma saulgeensis TaxID=1789683 RepID=A0A1X7QWT1_9SACH|nr:similar to Saccharomyces cerevisiae YKR090W PXL1 LIM domain-containing protein that localizes to sites of polarized growth [Kazachstania saulgeensis]
MGVLKTSPYPKVQMATLKKAGFQFNYKKIIKRSTVQPKKFSGYFDVEDTEDLLHKEDKKKDQLQFTCNVFELPVNTALRANMGSIIVNKEIKGNTPQLMHENNIFFHVDDHQDIEPAMSSDIEGVDSLLDYVTADDDTPVTTKGKMVHLDQIILLEGSPLKGKQNTIVQKNTLPTLIDLNGLTDDSITMLDSSIKVDKPMIQMQHFKEYEPTFLDSTDSLVANLSQSTVFKEGIQLIDTSSDEFEDIEIDKKNIAKMKWPTGMGPCRFCEEEIITNFDKRNKSLKPIYAKELHGQWHRGCFKCSDCSIKLDRHNQCYVYDDEPYCQLHYHEHNGSLCNICQGIIEGECLENHKRERFHIKCMECYVCNTLITNDYTLINGTVPICKEHDLETLAEQGIFEL